MAVIITVVAFVLGIVAAAMSNQLADEFKQWTPWVVDKLIKRAVLRLPPALQERFGEEWRSHINEVPGQIAKLIAAFSLLSTADKIGGQGCEFSRRWASSLAYAFAAVPFLSIVILVVEEKLTASEVVLWLPFYVASAGGFLRTFGEIRRIGLTRYYLGFVAFASTILYVVCILNHGQGHTFRLVNSIVSVTNDVLLFGLVLSVLSDGLPSRFVKRAGVFLAIGVLGFGILLLAAKPHLLLADLKLGIEISGLLIACVLFAPNVGWKLEHKLIVAGITIVLLSEIIQTFHWTYQPANRLETAIEGYASLVTLILLGAAGSSRNEANTHIRQQRAL